MSTDPQLPFMPRPASLDDGGDDDDGDDQPASQSSGPGSGGLGHRWGKGHPYYPPKNRDVGRGAERRRKMRELSLIIREEWPPEQMFAWLRAVAAGKDPDAEQETLPDGTKVDRGHVPPDWGIRMRAVKMLLERALGLPAQHVQIEADVRAALGVAAVSADASSWKNMPVGTLNDLRTGLRQLAAAALRQQRDDDDPD